MCPSPLAFEAKSKAAENPSTVEVKDQSDESDSSRRVDVPWSDIPLELLNGIANYLENRIDVSRFRAVCKQWRACIPPPLTPNLLCSLLPHKLSTTTAPFIDMRFYCSNPSWSLVLVASAVYLLRPCDQSLGGVYSKSWLIAVEESKPGKLSLRLPFRSDAMNKLPENFPSALNLLDLHASEIGKEYHFRSLNSPCPSWPFKKSFFPSRNKVVFFSDSVCTSPISDDTTALVLHGRGSLFSFIVRGEVWLRISYGGTIKFDDIVSYKGKIYTIDRKGRVYVITNDVCQVSRIVDDGIGTGSDPDRQKRLVESYGELYLVVRYNLEDKIYFRVYKLNEDQRKWDELRTLGDRILFLTRSICFLGSVRQCPGWKGNCIVFPEDCLPCHTVNTNHHPDRRFFKEAEKELAMGVFRLDEDGPARLIKCYPGYSDLFWPPPAWLQRLPYFSRNEQGQMGFRCQQSQEEEISRHNKLELTSEEQIIKNSSICESPVQASKTMNFLGVDVRSEFVPILEKICSKYGNVAEGSWVRGPYIAASALESLAEVVLILKSTPGESLDKSQGDILRNALADLQGLHFRVDWLVPFIDKALACLRIKQLREVEDNHGEAMRRLLEEIADMEGKLAELETQMEEYKKVLGPIDPDKSVGEDIC